ncbi:hypothetical protein [Actinoplanes sp. NPDC049265]|uniref:hypothetical protein n=1 Tax=Actinoplanes sp. NPDC049265 TaxID=3363902 RepID=UPI003714B4AC
MTEVEEASKIGPEMSGFLKDLNAEVAASGFTQVKISQISNIPQTTLSDILRGKRAKLPSKHILVGLLKACNVPEEKINAWDERRVALLMRGTNLEYTATRDEVRQLATKLDRATITLEALRAREQRLRAELEEVRRERSGLVVRVEEYQVRAERSERELSSLNHRLSRYEDFVRRLEEKLDAEIEETRKAQNEIANLQSEFERAQIELMYAGFQREQSREELWTPGAYELRMEAARKSAHIDDVRGLCRSALEVLRSASREFSRKWHGTPAEEEWARVNSLLAAADEELTNTLPALEEFAQRTIGQASALMLSEVIAQVERCHEDLAGYESQLSSCLEAVLAAGDGRAAYFELAGFLSQATAGLENCMGATFTALQILDGYR